MFPEGEDPKILRAAHLLVEEAIAHPILLGRIDRVRAMAEDLGVPLEGITIEEPGTSRRRDQYAQFLWHRRQRKGLSLSLGQPVYVTAIAPATNRLEIGREDALYRSGLIARHVNMVKYANCDTPTRVRACVRYKDDGAPATARTLPDRRLRVDFDGPPAGAATRTTAGPSWRGRECTGPGAR